jgi:hypothetical protein
MSKIYLFFNTKITFKISDNENFPHNIASKHTERSSLLVCFEVTLVNITQEK